MDDSEAYISAIEPNTITIRWLARNPNLVSSVVRPMYRKLAPNAAAVADKITFIILLRGVILLNLARL